MVYNLSIIIPTRNRQKYCIEVIKQVTANTSESVEIVVQDNSDSDILKGMLLSQDCDRLVYHYEPRILSFVDNFSAAVDHAHGEYLCVIGDDDGILPNIESLVIYAHNHHLDALIPGLNLVYLWPSEHPIVRNAEDGYLVLSYLTSDFRRVDVESSLKKLLDNGCQDYQKQDVPRLYHGIVHNKILLKIKEQAGTYFGGLTPDMYMAIALSLVCNRVEAIDCPVTISGICPKSGSTASATGEHTGELSQAPHFIGHDQYQWDDNIPELYSVETIWADTALHALKDFKRDELSAQFNHRVFLAKLWIKYPQFRKRIITHARKMNLPTALIVFTACSDRMLALFIRLLRRIVRRRGDVNKFYNITDIHAAASCAMELINRYNSGDKIQTR